MRKRKPTRELEQLSALRALLVTLSDDLALPFMQIKTSVEVLEQNQYGKAASCAHAHKATLSADSGLQLLEAYKLALQAHTVKDPALEPVSIGAVLQDVAHLLTDYAKEYSTELVVDANGKLTPVLAHRQSLIAALEVLGSSMIRAQAATAKQKKYHILFGAHRAPGNAISAGVYSNMQGLSDRTLRNARSLVGKAKQPLPAVPPGAASGILVADILCSAMWQPLRAAAHRNMTGLATSVPISKQLQLM